MTNLIEYQSPEWYDNMRMYRQQTRDMDDAQTTREQAYPKKWHTAPSQPSLGGPDWYTGNIDLGAREQVPVPGGHATIRSLGITDRDSGREMLTPSAVNGKILSNRGAMDNYYKTGKHLGSFNSIAESNKRAVELSNYMGDTYKPKLPDAKDIQVPERKRTLASKAMNFMFGLGN